MPKSMTSSEDMKSINEEIDAGVETVMQTIEAEREAERKADDGQQDDGQAGKALQQDASADTAGQGVDTNSDDAERTDGDDALDGSDDTGGTGDDDGDSDGDDDAVTDEHLERAIKAGLTMAEARKFGSASLLDTVVTRLEDAQGQWKR